MKNTVIVVDGSFMMHRSINGMKMENPSVYDLSFGMLKDFKSMIKELNKCGFGESVIYALDSPSWRKEIDISYKGNRDKKVDMKDAFDAHNKMLDVIKPFGINIIRVNKCEADDVIFKWCPYLAIESNNVLIISDDRDLSQIVRYYESKDTYIIQYRPNAKKLIVPVGFKEKQQRKTTKLNLSELLTAFDENSMDAILRFSKDCEIEEVNPDELSIIKMLAGDKNDNVSSVNEDIKNGKTYRFTENQALKALKLFKIQPNPDNILLDENLNLLNDCVKSITKKNIDYTEKMKKIYQMVVLNNLAFPKDILEALNNSLNRTIHKLNLKDFLNAKLEFQENELKISENLNKNETDPFWKNF